MDRPDQAVLLEIPAQPERPQAAVPPGEAKLKGVHREQTMLAMIYLEELIGPEHKARAIWELAGRLDLSRFCGGLKTAKGQPGRAAWDPQLLVSLWVYAYSEGISSAREIERLMEWEPGFQWLGALGVVSHHTLSDFRVAHQAALDELFVQLLGLLEHEGLLSLERVMHDGTKIRAQAGADSFRREKTVREHLERAREVVHQMGDPREGAGERSGKQAARERAARERKERLDQALKQLQALQADKRAEEEQREVRVSLTEPEARVMKHGDGAMAPSYNAQISTEAEHKIIVGAHLSACSSDAQSLGPALEEVERNLGRKPAQVVVDGGFTNRDNIVACAAQQTDLIGSLPDPAERSAAAMKAAGIDPAFAPQHFVRDAEADTLRCPAGRALEFVRQSQKRGNRYRQYQARGEDCRACPCQSQCCPRHGEQGRTVSILEQEPAEMAAFRQKMAQAEAQQIYRQRGAVAEFPNAWIKDKLGLRKFRVRGMVKAGLELVWACLTYNVMQWIRLCWRRSVSAATA